ncbi:ABC transporter permease [Clostridium sp. MSJ-11]|uniref:Transport permease protein n=1 Tax=Clostridium mobile TaxID=2841512 RepID=A0ABS6EJ17_9CLOT|nr:ABC transporter permease [Clostridium mobile]MBU5484435.1 ABC transporter permease [Clostridium mobile]
MRKFLTLAKIEGKLALRGIDGVFFGIFMPVGIAILIGMISGNQPAYAGATHSYIQENIPAIITVGICATAFMGIPLGIADYRDKKILKHYFVNPVSPAIILLVQVVLNMITAIVSSLSVLIVMKIFFAYEMDGNVIEFIFAYFLVMASMYGFGMLIASLCRSIKQANLVCTLVYFPMLFLSGATIPFSILPKPLQYFSNILPLTQGIKLLKGYALGIEINLQVPLLVMIISTVITVILSIKLFKWE